ncbi:MAG: ABC transporter ATP-binding protein [Polyangiaceae bacterium]|nr:ABC transporter ATP-binding protein [Polyangiaceae bacterium]
MKSVALSNVSVRFGKLAALTDVNVAVGEGQAVMLVGPNGAGKSTLIRVLLGLVSPDSGALSVDGAARRVDNRFKQQLGYLPEAVAFADNLTGRQVALFFARARGVPKSQVDAMLERVGLSHAARRAVRGYSRGMRQRLGLGIAILAQPALLILDEPTGGLDQEGLTVLWSVLAEWRSQGRLLLVATHDIALMERRIDRVCVFSAGRVLADATPAELRARAGLAVKVVFSVATEVEARALADGLRGRAHDVVVEGEAVSAGVTPAELLPLLELGAGSSAVRGVRVIEPGLDDVYERLLGGAA